MIRIACSALLLSIQLLTGTAVARDSAIERRVDFNIAAQPLAKALNALATQADIRIVFYPRTVEGLSAPNVTGAYTPQEALRILLANSDLHYRFTDARTVSVSSLESGDRSSSLPAADMRLAHAADATATDVQPSTTAEPQTEKLDEIIVTAQKRSERLQDVPVPVTAINAATLVNSNQMDVREYYTRIPGLSVAPTSPYGGSTIAIRGLSTGALAAGASSVGIVVDDVPYTGAGQGLSVLIPEIDPTDLARIEVLRGPQGTLYGANSLGGLLKYVTIDPSITGFSGLARAGVTGVENGDEAGYNASGAVNMPLHETMAIRVSGFTRRDPGYIDNPTHNREGVNWGRTSGGRVAALWAPSDRFSTKVGALIQDSRVNASTQVTLLPGSGDLQQNDLPDAGGYRKKIKIYTANVSAALGNATLTSITAYSDVDAAYFLDSNAGGSFTSALGVIANSFYPGVSGVLSKQTLSATKFTEEARLTIPIGNRVDWLMGAYYADDDKFVPTHQTARNYATGAEIGLLADTAITTSFKEYSAFTNVTLRFTDAFDLQVGGREGRYKTRYRSDSGGPRFGNVTTIGPTLSGKDSAFTYLVTPRYKVSPDLMVYARVATGYRTGGANTTITTGVPLAYAPDKTQNYELGVKGMLFDGALSFDASLYHIDWNDIQLTVREPTISSAFVANAGKARSRGVELSVEAQPLTGMNVAAWVTYNDAELTENLPATAVGVVGRAGERLPLGARRSGSVSLDRQFPLSGKVMAFAGSSLSYVGDREGSFRTGAAARRPQFPSYVKLDLRAGVRYDAWEFSLFANNLADKRAILEGDAAISPNFTFIQPRTVGLWASSKF